MNAAEGTSARSGRNRAFVGILGVLSLPLFWYGIAPYQVNITRYILQYSPGPMVPSTWVSSVLTFAAPLVLAAWAAASTPGKMRLARFFELSAPLVLAVPVAIYTAGGFGGTARHASDSASSQTSSGFHAVLLAILGAAWTAYRAGAAWEGYVGTEHTNHAQKSEVLRFAQHDNAELRSESQVNKGAYWAGVFAILAAVAALTFVHVRIQQNFFNHFMFGHADIGHFTEELKNALAGRGLRSDSFDNTRLGWHFVPLMYVLVPGYAIWPSITYLMTLGPLVLHLTALPVYWFVHRRAESVLVAMLCALAWLLLPSLSRLVYSNTYGFAWLYTSVPVLALLLGAALMHRWKLCWAMVAVLLLSRETNTAITLGLGLYIALFTPRKRAGAAVMAVSVAYALLCAAVIIPYFAKAGRYERLDIFGDLGGSVGELAVSAFTKPGLFFGRLARAEGIQFLLLLLATTFFLPARGWRLSIAAAPSMLVLLLFENSEWISIKFWHHALILPVLFFGGLSTLTASGRQVRDPVGGTTVGSRRNMGLALALLISAAWGHFFFGFSPLSKAYEPYARDAFLQNPDARLAFVEKLRGQIPRDKTILASERLAAHFTDYKRVYTGGRIRPADYIIIDLTDQWDTSGLRDKAAEWANSGEYEQLASERPIVVLARKPDAPAVELDP